MIFIGRWFGFGAEGQSNGRMYLDVSRFRFCNSGGAIDGIAIVWRQDSGVCPADPGSNPSPSTSSEHPYFKLPAPWKFHSESGCR